MSLSKIKKKKKRERRSKDKLKIGTLEEQIKVFRKGMIKMFVTLEELSKLAIFFFYLYNGPLSKYL